MNQELCSVAPEILAKSCAAINALEDKMAELPALKYGLTHKFTAGLYARTIRVPAGAVFTSKIHRTEHQFIVTAGRYKVWTQETGWEYVAAPHHGITTPGTRRVFVIFEELVLTTFHPTDKRTPEEVEADIIEPHEIPVQSGGTD